MAECHTFEVVNEQIRMELGTFPRGSRPWSHMWHSIDPDLLLDSSQLFGLTWGTTALPRRGNLEQSWGEDSDVDCGDRIACASINWLVVGPPWPIHLWGFVVVWSAHALSSITRRCIPVNVHHIGLIKWSVYITCFDSNPTKENTLGYGRDIIHLDLIHFYP